jgi:hypothetical protein
MLLDTMALNQQRNFFDGHKDIGLRLVDLEG